MTIYIVSEEMAKYLLDEFGIKLDKKLDTEELELLKDCLEYSKGEALANDEYEPLKALLKKLEEIL